MNRRKSTLLSEANKDAIILELAALIEQLAGRIKTLEASRHSRRAPCRRHLERAGQSWRAKLFVFATDRRMPATNNISEREIRLSVVFRKVRNGFRSEWGAQIRAGYRSVTGTIWIKRQTPLEAVRSLVDGTFGVA